MGILRAFADESGKASDKKIGYISMAAVIGREEQWIDFAGRWNEFLRYHEIPYLHMKEVVGAMHSKKGVFAKFENPQQLLGLLDEAAKCILNSGLFCCGLSVGTEALKKVLRAHVMKADPYAFTLYQTVVGLGTWALNNYPSDPSFQLILDRIEKGHLLAAQAEKLYSGDVFASWRGWPAVTPMPKNDRRGSREIVELQAADVVAWSIRNQLNHIGRWMREVKPTLSWPPGPHWDDSLLDWLAARNGELADTQLTRVNFLALWARLIDAKALKYYAYDEERLENHIFRHRDMPVNAGLKARTIEQAGREFPLSP